MDKEVQETIKALVQQEHVFRVLDSFPLMGVASNHNLSIEIDELTGEIYYFLLNKHEKIKISKNMIQVHISDLDSHNDEIISKIPFGSIDIKSLL